MTSAVPTRVSIVMPVFNAANWLAYSIGSVRAQSYADWELLAVDDASQDESLAILRRYAAEDPRIRPIALPFNRGVAAARNAGIAAAGGRWIAFLDSDDAWAPDKLERQVADLVARDLDVSYGGYERVDEQGRVLARVVPPETLDHARLLESNHIGNLTAAYDRRLGALGFRALGHEDYVFWLDALRRARRVARVPGDAPLGRYTVRAGSVSSNKLRAARWQWRIYREVEGLGRMRAAQLMLRYAGHALAKRVR